MIQWMDSFRLCLAFGPVAVYLLVVGAVSLSRRPLLVSGTRDAAALGLAAWGLVIVGPIELFFPSAAAVRFGPYVWLFLLSFYGLCWVLALLLLRPRLIVYNVAVDQLRPILADLVARLDPEARWAGDSVTLPSLGVQLAIDGSSATRHVTLAAVGPDQNYQGWRRLEQALAAGLQGTTVPRNARALLPVSLGLLTIAALALLVARDPQAIAQSLFEMLRL